jgi:hypothetical protein
MPTPKVNSWLGWRIFTVNTCARRSVRCSSGARRLHKGEVSHPAHRPLLCHTGPLRPVTLGPVASSSTQCPYRREIAPPTCSLDHRRAPRAAHSFAPAATSPEQGAPRPATAVAAARPHRRHHRPKLRSKSSLGTLLVALRLCPAGPGRRFARIWPDRRRPVPEDYIAKFRVFLRA